jgi:hypothetical protein
MKVSTPTRRWAGYLLQVEAGALLLDVVRGVDTIALEDETALRLQLDADDGRPGRRRHTLRV